MDTRTINGADSNEDMYSGSGPMGEPINEDEHEKLGKTANKIIKKVIKTKPAKVRMIFKKLAKENKYCRADAELALSDGDIERRMRVIAPSMMNIPLEQARDIEALRREAIRLAFNREMLPFISEDESFWRAPKRALVQVALVFGGTPGAQEFDKFKALVDELIVDMKVAAAAAATNGKKWVDPIIQKLEEKEKPGAGGMTKDDNDTYAIRSYAAAAAGAAIRFNAGIADFQLTGYAFLAHGYVVNNLAYQRDMEQHIIKIMTEATSALYMPEGMRDAAIHKMDTAYGNLIAQGATAMVTYDCNSATVDKKAMDRAVIAKLNELAPPRYIPTEPPKAPKT